jgi:hypothetical protein
MKLKTLSIHSASWRSEIIFTGGLSWLVARPVKGSVKVVFSADLKQQHVSETSRGVAALLRAASETQ